MIFCLSIFLFVSFWGLQGGINSIVRPKTMDDTLSSSSSSLPASDDGYVDRFAALTIIDDNDNEASASETVSTVTHIIFLIHGWMGNALEMGYIRESIQNAVIEAADKKKYGERHHRFVIHSAVCNEDCTNDGIVAGGSRIAEEINALVRHIIVGDVCDDSNSNSNNHDDIENKINTNRDNCSSSNSSSRNVQFHSDPITLTIIGNSLGGLYARQSLAEINWNLDGVFLSTSSSPSSPSVTLTPMIFLTTATPHLGISRHTYIPLPRAAEFVVAKGMQETGKDFFLFNTVLEDLFNMPCYMEPLSRFQERLAYVNVYGTDFQVPTATAAFWAAGSNSPHHRVQTSAATTVDTDNIGRTRAEDNDVVVEGSWEPSTTDIISTPKEIVMTLTTPRQIEISNEETYQTSDSKKDENEKGDDPSELYRAWSKRLDQLGWTKVLVDVRENVPSVPVPSPTVTEASNFESDVKGDDGSSNSDSNSIVNGDSNSDDGDQSNDININEVNNEMEGGSSDKDSNIIDMVMKDNWTAGELLTKFKGGLLSGTNSKSFWSIKPRIPVRFEFSLIIYQKFLFASHSIVYCTFFLLPSLTFFFLYNSARAYSYDSKCQR